MADLSPSGAQTKRDLPVMAPPNPAAGDASELVRDLRRFHFAPGSAEAASASGCRPALAGSLGSAEPAAETGDLAPFHMLFDAARRRVLPARAALREEAHALAAPGMPRGGRPEAGAEGGAMGALGARFIDPSSLTEMLTRSHRAQRTSEQQEGLESAFATLELLADAPLPELVLVHGASHGVRGLEGLERAHARPGGEEGEDHCAFCLVEHDHPCAGAGEIFDREAERLAQILCAIRRIRLEAAGEYRPERHDSWLEQFDWQAFSRDELLLLPPVVALVSADEAAGRGMVSLSRLLLSGRPVQAIVLTRPALNPGTGEGGEPLTGFRFEPAYLGLSHREALVQQTSAARPEHMARGFEKALGATHAALHVIAMDDAAAPAAFEGRAHPLFHYDPEAGSSWAERLDFTDNPQPGEDWPVHELEVRRPGAGEETLRLPFTFADFALLEPSYAHHFAAVPDGVPDRELVAMADFCAASPDEESRRVPYVWAVDGASQLRRLAVSRPLALACRDRLGFWRTLQELSGVRSEYARRAAEEAREKAEAQAGDALERVEKFYAEELDRTRREAARDVVDRLTSALLEVDVSALPPLSAAAPGVALAGLSGGSVDEVSAALLALADPAGLRGKAAPSADGRVAEVTSELMRLLGDS